MYLFKRRPKPQVEVLGLSDGAIASIVRGRSVEQRFRLGPNEVSAIIFHEDGTYTDLGISHNLLTNGGRDLIAAAIGGVGFGVTGTIATASSATSLTATGTPFTTDAFKGWIVIAEESTNAPVWGNIGSNTTSVLTVDAWRTGDDTSGTTPGSTANYLVLPNGRARYMALSETAGSPVATDTTLPGEITTGGCNRQFAAYAHTGGTSTFTLQKSYSVTASFPAIHRMGLFTASTSTAAGILLFETALNADANVISGDTLQVTDTVTLS